MGFLEAPLLSRRVGEVRLADVRPRIDPGTREIDILVLRDGDVPLRVGVRIGRRWAGGGWCSAFECPACEQPANVLRASAEGLRCARCLPHLTPRQRAKNTTAWTRFDGEFEDRLLRTAMKGGARHDLEQLAASLLDRDEARVAACGRGAQQMIEAIDGLLVFRSD